MKKIIESHPDFICNIQAPCFQSLSSVELDVVKASRTQVHFRKGENLTKQGAYTSYVLFAIKGMAKQYIETDIKNFNLHIITPGDFIGLSAAFLNNIFNYSTVALTDFTAYLIEKEAIIKVIENNGHFGLNMIKRYCSQHVSLYEKLSTVLYKQMNGRIAEAILYIDSLKKYDSDVFNYLSRKDIADFAGITMESAVKILKKFDNEGIISLHEKNIVINNKENLLLISKNG